jgi:uncharacterized membrane protein
MSVCQQCGSQLSKEMAVCPTCGSSSHHRQQPEEAQSKTSAMAVRRWMVRGLVAAVVLLGIAVFLNQLLRTYHPVIDAQPVVAMSTMYRDDRISSTPIDAAMDAGFISIPLKVVQEKKLVRFFDPEKIQNIPMIAYITPQGKLVTAMSKSEHCGSTDFFLSGNDIHCASCASYWNMASMEAYACCQKYYPDPFPSSVVGDEIRIDPDAIRNWKGRL